METKQSFFLGRIRNQIQDAAKAWPGRAQGAGKHAKRSRFGTQFRTLTIACFPGAIRTSTPLSGHMQESTCTSGRNGVKCCEIAVPACKSPVFPRHFSHAFWKVPNVRSAAALCSFTDLPEGTQETPLFQGGLLKNSSQNRQSSSISYAFLRCFRETFSMSPNASFPVGILSFAGAPKGTQETPLFTVEMPQRFDKSVKWTADSH